MRVLVVDDQNLNLQIVNGYLRQLESIRDILLCNNPMEVMNLIVRNDIDIVILDIVMPNKSGIDVLKEIREYNDDIQIIMLTSLEDMDSFETCFNLGANDYVRKPINFIEFKARIKSAVNTRSYIKLIKEMYSSLKTQNDELENLNKKFGETKSHMLQKEKFVSISRKPIKTLRGEQ